MINLEVQKAAIYCRLSSDDGNDGDSSSIQTQRSMLEKYCKEQGFYIHDIYVDDGYSGVNFNRPSFQRMIQDIELGKVNIVITKDQSRLGRNYVMTGYYMDDYFPSKKVRYIAINDGIDSEKENNDIAPFRNILNDMFSKDLSKKVKTAKRQRAMQGLFISGQCPFGYKKNPINPGQLIIDEEAAIIVKEIFRLALLGRGAVGIALDLTKNKVITPAAYKAKKGDTKFERYYKLRGSDWEYNWCYATVAHILKDIVYIGDMENRKYEVQNYKTKIKVKVSKDKHIIVPNTHEAIIAREDFARVQELIKSRARPIKHEYENIFRGIVYCKECKHRMTLALVQKRKQKVLLFKCMHHAGHPDLCLHHNDLKYEKLVEIVENKIRSLFEMFKDDEKMDQLIKERTIKYHDNSNYDSEKEKIEKRLISLNKLTKKVYEDFIEEVISERSYQEMVREYQDEVKSLEERLIEIQKKLLNKVDNQDGFMRLKNMLFEFISFKRLTKEMIYRLIDRIEIEYIKEVNGKKIKEIDIYFRFIKNKL